MNPAQFLDPKGWAKQQKKGSGKRRMPTGPKQSRKSTTSEVADKDKPTAEPAGLRFDPKALLAPRGAGSSSKPKDAALTSFNGTSSNSHNVDGDIEEDGPGMASFLERQHKLKTRQVELPRKRKAGDADDNEIDERRKPKGHFIGGSNGGVLGQYVKDEREKGSKQQNAPGNPLTQGENNNVAIDLTNDDDEIEITGENKLATTTKQDASASKEDGNEEICMGTLKTNVNAYRIPAPGVGGTNKLNKDWWPKMKVSLKREANSTNIIHFIDTTGKTFGQMVINAASGLCPLLDGVNVSKLRTKTYLDARKRGRNEAPGQSISEVLVAHTTLFCPRNKKTSIGRFLSQRQLFLNDPVGMILGTPVENPHTLKKFGPSLDESRSRNQNSGTGPGNARYIQRTQEEMRRDASTMFDSLTKASEDLPEAEASEVITTPLMEHQKKALHFLLDHEKKESEETAEDSKWSLWKPSRQRAGWVFNVITGEEIAKPPKRVQGGILADVMGLGKTLSILALIATTMGEAAAFGNEDPTEEEFQKTPIECSSKATLLICPKSVMSNWIEQIGQHTSGKLKVYAYHGSNREQNPEVLAKYDIVLTTYNTAAAEFNDGNRQTRALEAVKWFRIVLDEAHQIRTASTKVSKACCALLAERRWAMTGTPVQNRLDDLGALIKFIRLKPFDESYNWAHYIIAPFKNADHNVLEHLQLLVHSATLRRVKDTIDLVGRREVREIIPWPREERIIYDNFARSARIQTSQMMGGVGLKGKAYAHVLRTIGRLRAICVHGKEMLSEEDQQDLENLKGSSSDTAIELFDEPDSESAIPQREEVPFITENQAYEMLTWMRDSEMDMCSRCGERVSEDRIGVNEAIDLSSDSSDEDSDESFQNASDKLGLLTQSCLHLICSKCEDVYKQQVNKSAHKDGYWTCPIDSAYVRAATFPITKSGFANFQRIRADAAQRKKKGKWEDRDNYSGQSSKVKHLIHHLHENAEESANLPKGEPPIRSVIFTGWTSFLDLIEIALVDEGFKFVRLDGSMSIKQRTAVLNTFKEDPDTTVLIVSIKAGGQGLNFTTANKVYMMEPQFNPGVEQQAIDRVHRLGQRRDVEIVHLIMQDSIEQSILELQEKKNRLAKLSMDKKRSGQEEAKNTMQQLSELFK